MKKDLILSPSGQPLTSYALGEKDLTIEHELGQQSTLNTFPGIRVCTHAELGLALSETPNFVAIQQAVVESGDYVQFDFCNLKKLPDLKLPPNTKLIFITKLVSDKIPVLENGGVTFVEPKILSIKKDTLFCVGLVKIRQ